MKFLIDEVRDNQRLLNDPRRLLYADDSRFPFCLNSGKGLAEKGAWHVYHFSTSNKPHIITMVCFNAFSGYFPPFIFYPGIHT